MALRDRLPAIVARTPWLTRAVTTLASGIGLTDPRLYAFMGGGPTAAGEIVSVQTAMQIDTVFACVRLIAQTLATLPCQFFLKNADGFGAEATDHPLYTILHDQPNADMSAVSFWEAMVACLMLWGNAYSAIYRRGDGQVSALIPLVPSRLTMQPNADGTAIRYAYRTDNGQMVSFDQSDIFHIKLFTLDGKFGLSPIAQARENLGTAIAAERSAGSFFRNGMRPSAVIIAPNFLDPKKKEEFRADFTRDFTGALQAGRVPLIEGGWKVDTLSMNPDDAQLLATRQFTVEQICRWYGVQPVMVGHMEKTTAWGTGMEQMNLWFLTYTLRPIMKAIEQEIRRALIIVTERQKYYAEFNADGLMRTDSKGRADMMATLADHGLRTRNELRALDNMPPLPGGDDLTIPVNLTPAQDLGKTPPAPPPPQIHVVSPGSTPANANNPPAPPPAQSGR